MEEEYLKLQKIEFAIDSERTVLQKILDKFGITPTLYTQRNRQQALLDEIDQIIETIANTGRVRGEVMTEKAMRRYLEKGERTLQTDRELAKIDRLSISRAKARLSIYKRELQKEGAILEADIDLFFRRGKLAGFSERDLLKQLTRAAADKEGLVPAFGKRVRALEKAVLRREAASAKIDAYRRQYPKNDALWQWITLSVKPCPDCIFRAGKTLTWREWQAIGLPGEGRTVCMSHCHCDLHPLPVAEDLFPEVKEYKITKSTEGVFITPAERRKLGSPRAKAPQK